jgi:hypothetical protein
MGLGFQGAYGANAIQQGLRQRILDQIAEQQRQFENDLKTKQFSSNEELKNAQLQALVQNRTDESTARQNAGDIVAANTIPAQTELQPTPLAGRLVQMGLGKANMTLPSTQTSGGVGLPADAQDEQAAPVSGVLQAVQSPESLRSVTKLASSAQQKAADDAVAKVEEQRQKAQDAADLEQSRAADRENALRVAAALRPAKDTTGSDNARLDRSYQFNSGQLAKVTQPLADKQANLTKAADALAQRTPAADSLVVPAVLTAMVGGAGSGLRMNESEIKRIFGGRSGWENIKAALQHWDPNSGQALQITDAQRQQLGQLLDTAHAKIGKKLSAAREAAQGLVDATDVNQHRQIVADLQNKLDAIDSGVSDKKTTTRYDINGQPIKE